MDMIYFVSIIIVLFSINLHTCCATIYNGGNQQLTTVPADIRAGTTRINLENNKLTNIQRELYGLNVETFYAYGNMFTIFPNFSDIRTTLTALNLRSNILQYVSPENLNMLTKLQYLDLGYNKLSQFPDVPDPGNTLIYLDLAHNQFDVFPSLIKIGKSLITLTFHSNLIDSFSPEVYVIGSPTHPLQWLYVGYNNVKTVPLTVGPYLANNIQQLDMRGNPLKCDWRMIWLILLPRVDRLGNCSEPASMRGKDIGTLTISDFYAAPELSNESSSFYCKVMQGMYSLVMPLEKVALTKLECVTKCGSTQGCLYINYSENGEQCHFASPKGAYVTHKPTNEQEWAYYELMF